MAREAWMPDPWHVGGERWYDGVTWTEHVRRNGTQGVSPIPRVRTPVVSPADSHAVPPRPAPWAPPPGRAAEPGERRSAWRRFRGLSTTTQRLAWAGAAVVALGTVGTLSDSSSGAEDDSSAATTAFAVVQEPITSTSTVTATAPADEIAAPVVETTAAVVATEAPPPATLAPTGSRQACDAGQRLEDADGDLWGECIADVVQVNTWAAQAGAEALGLPAGTPCAYPASIVSGQTAVVACAVVNQDASEGTWHFTIASDSSVTGSADYVETRPAPTTLPPETFPPIRPAAALTDPRFDTCKEAIAHGYGRYRDGVDPEYDWYRDADSDGIVCE